MRRNMRNARACVDACGTPPPSDVVGVVTHLLNSDLRPFEYMCNTSYDGRNIHVKIKHFFRFSKIRLLHGRRK